MLEFVGEVTLSFGRLLVRRARFRRRDLWLTIANGIGGTPMPSYLGALSGEQIWDLVHFVQFLGSGSEATGRTASTIEV